MPKIFGVLVFGTAMLPAYSLTQVLLNIYTSNRFLSLILLPILLFFKFKKKIVLNHPETFFILFIGFFIGYTILAISEGRNVAIYFGYVVAFLYIILLFWLIDINHDFFLKFMKIFLLFNFFYVVIQIFLLNVGLGSWAMWHSNLMAQTDYTIPIFVSEPFYRYTGLFNESSPFAFYLAICHAFFTVFDNKKYKRLALILLIFSGSKAGYLYLLLYYFIYSGSRVLKFLLGGVLLFLSVGFFYFYDQFFLLTYSEMASLSQRQEAIFYNETELSPFGVNLGSTSEGELALDFFSIFSSGFGVVGLVAIIFLFTLFYRSIKSNRRHFFILPLLIGLLSSGSLLIFQYSLIFASLYYCHLRGRLGMASKNLIKSDFQQ